MSTATLPAPSPAPVATSERAAGEREPTPRGRRRGPGEIDLLLVSFWLMWVCLAAIVVLVAAPSWWVVALILVFEIVSVAVLLGCLGTLLEAPDLRPGRDRRPTGP